MMEQHIFHETVICASEEIEVYVHGPTNTNKQKAEMIRYYELAIELTNQEQNPSKLRIKATVLAQSPSKQIRKNDPLERLLILHPLARYRQINRN